MSDDLVLDVLRRDVWQVGSNGWWVRVDGTVWQFSVQNIPWHEVSPLRVPVRFCKPIPGDMYGRRTQQVQLTRCFHSKKDALRFAVLEALTDPSP